MWKKRPWSSIHNIFRKREPDRSTTSNLYNSIYYHQINPLATTLYITLHHGLWRTKTCRTHLSHFNHRLWRRRMDHWILSARLYDRVPSLVGGSCAFRYCTLILNGKQWRSSSCFSSHFIYCLPACLLFLVSAPDLSLFVIAFFPWGKNCRFVCQTGHFTTAIPSSGWIPCHQKRQPPRLPKWKSRNEKMEYQQRIGWKNVFVCSNLKQRCDEIRTWPWRSCFPNSLFCTLIK